MAHTRVKVIGAALGLLIPLGLATGSPAAAATCGAPVWDFNHDTHTDAIVGGFPGSQVLFSDGDTDIASSELGLAFPVEVTDDHRYPESFASISLYESSGDEEFCSLAVVGVPDATVDGIPGAGAVYVFRVNPGGDQSTETGDDELLFTITQANDGLDQTQPTQNARFGATVAAPDRPLANNGPTPLAIGAPGETVDGVTNAGSVAVLNLTQTGDVSSARRVTRAPGKGISKSSALGTSLAASRDSFSAQGGLFVAGAPGRTVSGKTAAGSVLLIPTNPAVAVKEVTQSTTGVQGTVETGDRFGFSVAATWNPALVRHEIGIGIPGENVGSVTDGGQVTTLRSTSGLSLTTIKSFTQNTTGVSGSVETGDKFGHAIAALWRAGKPAAWLIGVPFENVGSLVDSGQIQTIGEPTNRTWDNSAAFEEGPYAQLRFGDEVVGPRGDRGPIWLADSQIDDNFTGWNLPGWGDLNVIWEHVELQDESGTAIGG